MNDYGKLITTISQELNIKKDKTEDELEWIARVVYSSLGRIAQASLYDTVEDGEDISVIRFKKRIIRTLSSYINIFPELKSIYSLSPDKYADNIYDIYFNAGCFYHSTNRLSPAIYRGATYKNIKFIRGGIGESINVSGLGSYSISDNYNDKIDDLLDMYKIEEKNLMETYNDLLTIKGWEILDKNLYIEYLRTNGPFTEGYWINKYEKNNDISLLRVNSGRFYYYFYRNEENQLLVSPVSEWINEGLNYLTYANSIIYKKGNLPFVSAGIKDYIVNISLKYLLPTNILNFLLLYSWPKDFEKLDGFNRVIQKDIYSVFKNILNYMGIGVHE